ncbi:putative amidoligase domain-containing protein, partial [Paenibacillus pseudetheri]|uniref:putative amidoligase domain-containing protein n=1 Tax=Paenibacillus pseudetheri TaxID=2897682 RepID=UPI003C6E9496
MNEGFKVYSGLSSAQRESRLFRSGIEAMLTSSSKGMKGSQASLRRNQTSGERNRLEDTYETLPSDKAHKQCYNILMYNLSVLQITPLGAGPGMRAASDLLSGAVRLDSVDSSESMGAAPGEWRGVMKLLQRIAVRTLYSLGLDSGEVLLRAMGNRRYVVEGVTPLLQRSGKSLPEPYRSAALALERSLALEQPGRSGLLMGMDPEFIILRESTGRVVPASRYLPTDGVAGCDAGPPG